jgi:hypothetical protein
MITTRFTHLILASPGSDPFYQVGAVVALEKEKVQPLTTISNIAATSSSALIGLMLALDYQPQEIHDTYQQLYNPAFEPEKGFPAVKIRNQQAPAENAAALATVVEHVIEKKLGPRFTTANFSQLASFQYDNRNNVSNFRDLRLVAGMHDRETPELQMYVFSKRHSPSVTLLNATMAAAATPGLMPRVSSRMQVINGGLLDIEFEDGGYALPNPDAVYNSQEKITAADIEFNRKRTLHILNCNGRTINMPYAVEPQNRILMGQGAPVLDLIQPDLTDEQIQTKLVTGMNATVDFFNPQIVLQKSHSFLNRKSALQTFSIYNRSTRTAVPVEENTRKNTFSNT